MSDMTDDDPTLDAGLRALGLLDAEQQRALDARAASDPSLAAEIAAWEYRLAPLALIAGPVAPPADLWQRIATSLDANVAPLATRPSAWNSVRVWRGATAVSLALAASLAAFAFFRQPPATDPSLVAALSPAGATGATFLVRAAAGNTLLVRAIATVAPIGDDRALELWSLPEGASVPVSLGTLPTSGADLRIPAPALPGTKLLMSVEARGGSPTHAPTGPVVYAGQLAALD